MHNRNVLIVLDEIFEFFPLTAIIGERLKTIITTKCTNAEVKNPAREKMKTLATVYLNNVNRTSSQWGLSTEYSQRAQSAATTANNKAAVTKAQTQKSEAKESKQSDHMDVDESINGAAGRQQNEN